MVDSVNSDMKISEIIQTEEPEQKPQYNISYRGTDYEKTPDNDSFERENKTGKTVGIIAGALTAVALVVGGICLHKGNKAFEGKDASFGEKLKEGWKELWGKGKCKCDKPEENSKSDSPKTDGDKEPKSKENPESPKDDEVTKPDDKSKTDSEQTKTDDELQKTDGETSTVDGKQPKDSSETQKTDDITKTDSEPPKTDDKPKNDGESINTDDKSRTDLTNTEAPKDKSGEVVSNDTAGNNSEVSTSDEGVSVSTDKSGNTIKNDTSDKGKDLSAEVAEGAEKTEDEGHQIVIKGKTFENLPAEIEELVRIKNELRETMKSYGFTNNMINFVLNGTTERNVKEVQILINECYKRVPDKGKIMLKMNSIRRQHAFYKDGPNSGGCPSLENPDYRNNWEHRGSFYESKDEWESLRPSIILTMINRGFSNNTIEYVLNKATSPTKQKIAKMMVEDEYLHSSNLTWMIGYTTEENAHLVADAVKKKNYGAFYRLESSIIKSESEIEDLSEKVIKNGRKYVRQIKELSYIPENIEKETNEVIELVKQKGATPEQIDYIKSYCNLESIEIAQVLAKDKNATIDYMKWVIGYANAENADLFLRAVLNKDYKAVYSIQSGEIRNFDTLDARNAVIKRTHCIKEGDCSGFTYYETKRDRIGGTMLQYANDDISAATKILFEDMSYSDEAALKIAEKINKENVQEFKEALLDKDYERLSKLCGEKVSPNGKTEGSNRPPKSSEKVASTEFDNMSREEFILYMSDKTARRHFHVSILSDAEAEKIAEILGTTKEQVFDMDKKEYRRLCIKHHPDRNLDEKMANQIFNILNSIYQH